VGHAPRRVYLHSDIVHATTNHIPKIAIVVLNRNGLQDTRECIHSLDRLDYPGFEVILVDNASTDGSVSSCREEFPGIRVVESNLNLGFAGGNNLGIQMALSGGASYVLLLNNDTIADPELLKELLKVGESDSDIGILGAKIFYASDPRRIWYAGGEVLQRLGICRHTGLKQLDGEKFSQTSDTGFVTGCTMMIKASVFRKIGLLDPKLFMYWEDADFCMRARKAQFRCVFVPSAHVWHKVSQSAGVDSPFTIFLSIRNHLMWISRYVPPPYRWLALGIALVRRLMRWPMLAIRDRLSADAVCEGIAAFFRGKDGPPPGTKFAPPGLRSTHNLISDHSGRCVTSAGLPPTVPLQ
jgi:GT2 family glycosyltransferase